MNKPLKITLYGFLTWLIPFVAAIPFVDPATGGYTIDETLFKSIMIVVGALAGVILAVKYFQSVEKDFLKEGIQIGIAWLLINWGLDLVMVYGGLFDMSVPRYFMDIGLRYLSAPIYTTGLGYALSRR